MTAGLHVDLPSAERDEGGLDTAPPSARSPIFIAPARPSDHGSPVYPNSSPARRPAHPGRRARAIGIPAPLGLWRQDLVKRCLAAHAGGSVVVVGPPGAGKSTLAAQLASVLRDRGEHVGWFDVDGSARSPQELIEGVGEALLCRRVAGTVITSSRDLVKAVRTSEAAQTIVIEDAHRLTGELARTMMRAIDALAGLVRFVVTSRWESLDLTSALRLSGAVLMIEAEQLRFDVSDVECLFTEHYEQPLPEAAVAELTERTDGWIAAIDLFHLATSGRSIADRVAAVSALTSLRTVRHYLAVNVLDELSAEATELLLFGSLMGTVNPQWCDALLGRVNSAWVLDQLSERNLLVCRTDDISEPRFHYHPVLRQYLLGELAARIGTEALRSHHGKLARLYESIGLRHEALMGYLRAMDIRASNRMAGRLLEAREAVDGSGARGAVLLAEARSDAVNGRLDGALSAYRGAATALREVDLRDVCRREGKIVAAWLSARVPAEGAMTDWLGQLRRAVAHRPATLADHPFGDSTDGWLLASGMGALLDGRPGEAASRWTRMSSGRGIVALIGVALQTVASAWDAPDVMLSGLDRAVEMAEADHLDGIVAVLRAMRSLSGREAHIEVAEQIERECRAEGRPWLALVACATAAVGRCRSATTPIPTLRRCERLAAELGAGVVQAWSAAAMSRIATVCAGSPSNLVELSKNAAAMLRDTETPAEIAAILGWLSPAPLPKAPASVRSVDQKRVRPPGAPDVPTVDTTFQRAAGPLAIRCFGRFEMSVADAPVEWGNLRPRVQSVLRMLALRAGSGVHVDTLYDCFWPGAPLDSARRSLHVAVSMIRRVLLPAAAAGQPPLLQRRGEMYVLVPPADAAVDVLRFESAVRRWRQVRKAVELADSIEPLREALHLYTGDLLPEVGAVEWVLADRSRYRDMALDVAGALAATELKLGNPAAAAEVCATALDIDRYHDLSWRMLIRAHLAGNDVGAAQRVRGQYHEVLAELGVSHDASPGETPRRAQ